MSNAQTVLWVIAVAVGLFSAWRNPTALALLLAFAASEAGLPIELYTFPDILTGALIFMKPRYRPCPDYWDLSTWEMLKCLLGERTPADRIILLTLPVAWYFYIADIHPYYQYWWLYWIAVVQFAAAGLEPILPFILRRFADAASHQSHSRNGLEAAIA